MTSFFKFKNNKNSEDSPVRTEPTMKSRRQVLDDDNQESMSENPEVQRARHRLLGAVFLLLIAIIGLPRIFDAEPKIIKNDVVIKVLSSVSDSVNSNEEKPPVDNTFALPSSLDEKIPTVNSTKIQDTKSSSNSLLDNNEVVISESAPKETDKSKAKFYIQVATFSTNDRVKKMSAKLKELKISSYKMK
jgi:DedD protein